MSLSTISTISTISTMSTLCEIFQFYCSKGNSPEDFKYVTFEDLSEFVHDSINEQKRMQREQKQTIHSDVDVGITIGAKYECKSKMFENNGKNFILAKLLCSDACISCADKLKELKISKVYDEETDTFLSLEEYQAKRLSKFSNDLFKIWTEMI